MRNLIFFCEIRDEYKRYFESKMAIKALIENKQLYISLQKVSDSILKLLKVNEAGVKRLIQKNIKIKKDLYGIQWFGRLKSENVNGLTSNQIYKHIVATLENRSSNLSSLIHIHAVFIHRIYDFLGITSITSEDNCKVKEKKSTLVKQLFYSELFKDRGRVLVNENPPSSRVAGINLSSFFQKKLKVSVEEHIPAIHCFEPNKQSDFFKKISLAKMPFVAGPSGHMGSLLLGAELYGQLDSEQSKEYAFLCASYLVCGGNHSFFECIVVANQLYSIYNLGDYSSFMPESFKTRFYLSLLRESPPFINDEVVISSPCQLSLNG